MKFEFGSQSKKNLEYLQEDTIKLCNLALKESLVDFTIIDGYRTTQQQQELYMQGKTELDGLVNKSAHQSGLAVDVIPYVKDIDIWDVDNTIVLSYWFEIYRAFMRAGRKLKLFLEFGFSYNVGGGRDFPHIQIVGKKDR